MLHWLPCSKRKYKWKVHIQWSVSSFHSFVCRITDSINQESLSRNLCQEWGVQTRLFLLVMFLTLHQAVAVLSLTIILLVVFHKYCPLFSLHELLKWQILKSWCRFFTWCFPEMLLNHFSEYYLRASCSLAVLVSQAGVYWPVWLLLCSFLFYLPNCFLFLCVFSVLLSAVKSHTDFMAWKC